MKIKNVAIAAVNGFAILALSVLLPGCKEDYSDPKAFFDKYFMEDWFNPRYGGAAYQKAMRFKEVRVDNLRLEPSYGMTAVCADVRIIPEPGVIYINKRNKPWHVLTTESWDTSLSGSKLDGDSYLRASVIIRRVKLDNGVFVPSEKVRDRGGLNYAIHGFCFLEDLQVYKPSDSNAMAEMLKPLVEELEKVAGKKDERAARHELDAYVWTEYAHGNQFRFINDTAIKQRLYVALRKLIDIVGWNDRTVRDHKISKILRLLPKVEMPRERLKEALSKSDFEKAHKEAESVLKMNPNDVEANFAVGMWHYQHKRWEEAEKSLLICKKRARGESAVWNNLAMIYLKMGKLEVAMQHARKALSLKPDSSSIKDTIKQVEKASAK